MFILTMVLLLSRFDLLKIIIKQDFCAQLNLILYKIQTIYNSEK